MKSRTRARSGEVDQNFQIEDGIRQTLNCNPVASVDVSHIESCYDALEADGSVIPTATLNGKCQQLADMLNVDYSIKEALIIFRPKRPIR